ncbi:MAG: hypothetical protein AABY22_24000, partial [Nanoarchaeota archaeon]
MIANKITTQIICDSCQHYEVDSFESITRSDDYIKSRVVPLTKKQSEDRNFIGNILYSKEYRIKMGI